MPNARRPARVLMHYAGINRRGVAETGTLETARGPVAFVERKHRQGWRSLTVRDGGEEVGRIEQSRPGARRTWWATDA